MDCGWENKGKLASLGFYSQALRKHLQNIFRMSSRKLSKSTSSSKKDNKLLFSNYNNANFYRSKKKNKKIEAVFQDKDSFDLDDELSMSMLSGTDTRRKSMENDLQISRKNKVFQHIKKEMDLRAKTKHVCDPSEQVLRDQVLQVNSHEYVRFILWTSKEMPLL